MIAKNEKNIWFPPELEDKLIDIKFIGMYEEDSKKSLTLDEATFKFLLVFEKIGIKVQYSESRSKIEDSLEKKFLVQNKISMQL